MCGVIVCVCGAPAKLMELRWWARQPSRPHRCRRFLTTIDCCRFAVRHGPPSQPDTRRTTMRVAASASSPLPPLLVHLVHRRLSPIPIRQQLIHDVAYPIGRRLNRLHGLLPSAIALDLGMRYDCHYFPPLLLLLSLLGIPLALLLTALPNPLVRAFHAWIRSGSALGQYLLHVLAHLLCEQRIVRRSFGPQCRFYRWRGRGEVVQEAVLREGRVECLDERAGAPNFGMVRVRPPPPTA